MRYLVVIAACMLFAAPSLSHAQSQERAKAAPTAKTPVTTDKPIGKAIAVTPSTSQQPSLRTVRNKQVPRPLSDVNTITAMPSNAVHAEPTPVATSTSAVPLSSPTPLAIAKPTNEGGK